MNPLEALLNPDEPQSPNAGIAEPVLLNTPIARVSGGSEESIAGQCLANLRMSRHPAELRALRGEILVAIAAYLEILRSDANPDSERESAILAQAEAAAELIRQKPLIWFADRRGWELRGENQGAAWILKREGRIGKGWTKLGTV